MKSEYYVHISNSRFLLKLACVLRKPPSIAASSLTGHNINSNVAEYQTVISCQARVWLLSNRGSKTLNSFAAN